MESLQAWPERTRPVPDCVIRATVAATSMG